MPRTFKDAKAWLDTYECQTKDEQELIVGFQDILEELESEYKKDQEECHKNVKEKYELYQQNEVFKKQQLFQKDFDGIETFFGEGDWTGYTEQRPWIKMHKTKKLAICDCPKPCGWYLGHYRTHDEYLKKKGK
ncbi:hypothetical protein [Spiroplasma sp. DGKH1]|uniref:hypothetical protein n=1 Tax=Spiroplasma sp. DGKH1 TaxID=3050074 RepID=UPI0034C5EEC5